jgi:prepilin-type N-terminal cleavage/methylation domain-containing protein
MKMADCRLPIANCPRVRARQRAAFTLIEMLVVIAIIAILAAILVSTLGRSGEAKVRSRVQAELNQLIGAIESFHKKHGFYPPGNERKVGNNLIINTGTNQLFYELTGTEFDKDNDRYKDNFDGTIGSATIGTEFNAKGFVNSGADKFNFHPNLKPSGHSVIPGTSVRVLVVPYRGPGGDFNPWHYNSSKPVRNPDSFDLWAEVDVGGKRFTIGNWKD